MACVYEYERCRWVHINQILYVCAQLMCFVSILLCTCLQEYDCLMVDEINDVRIIGVITAVVMMAVALAGLSWESKVTRQFIRSINQSVFTYIRQPEPIQARPIHIKRKKRAFTTLYKITTQTNEKRVKLSRYWSETSAAEVHTYIFQLFPQIVAELIHSTSW